MVILGMDSAEPEMVVNLVLDLGIINKRPPRYIAVHSNLEYVVLVTAIAEPSEIPEIVMRLVEEIKAVQTFHPADSDFDIEIVGIDICAVAVFRVVQEIGPVGVFIADNVPVVSLSIDTGNHIAWELEYLEFQFRPPESVHPGNTHHNKHQQYCCHSGHGTHSPFFRVGFSQNNRTMIDL